MGNLKLKQSKPNELGTLASKQTNKKRRICGQMKTSWQYNTFYLNLIESKSSDRENILLMKNIRNPSQLAQSFTRESSVAVKPELRVCMYRKPGITQVMAEQSA